MSRLTDKITAKAWKRIGTGKRTGVAVPLFSLHSSRTMGIGDFGDLETFLEWCEITGITIVQLLPMNETGPVHCPYDSISSFAIDPMYIDIDRIKTANGDIVKEIERVKRKYSSVEKYVDYQIKEDKRRLLREIYNDVSEDSLPEDFDAYQRDNAYWIEDYALFKILKSRNGGRSWEEWPEREYDFDSALDGLNGEERDSLRFHKWVQWIAYCQFSEIKNIANKKGIFVKGDMPVLVSRDSADVWAKRPMFKLDFAAGAPPDMYCSKGQRWGMPTYNWSGIKADGYAYIKEKLSYAGNFYDMLRIDHVVGLFRIWSIPFNEPGENEGLNGHFDPENRDLWRSHGEDILKVIVTNTDMLLCAEDLGSVPPECPQVLKDIGIPGNEVQRWTKDWVKKHDFISPHDYRHLSVSMLSTHDTTIWPAWWENEAGTVDESLFVRKCSERGADFMRIKNRLFDAKRSAYNRLRWKESVSEADISDAFARPSEELGDIIDMYKNTFGEKEKLWNHMGFSGKLREKADSGIIESAFRLTSSSNSVFNIELFFDWLSLLNVIENDYMEQKINAPGTVNERNWSLRSPVSLEELKALDKNRAVREMIERAGRSGR